MPYLDLNAGDCPVNATDYTIIGAGAAGILLAVKLFQAGKKVLLIESGHFEVDENRQKLNEVEQTGKYLNNAIWGRKRVIGGTTVAWGGQSLPFGPLDFEQRSWVENSGWPVSFSELEPYYPIANDFMKIDSLDYKGDIFRKIRLEDPGFNKSIINYHVAKWAKEPNFRKLYDGILQKEIPVLYNAQFEKANLGHHGEVVSIDVVNFNKEKFTLPVKNVILATGGIETNRILLNNRHLFKNTNNASLVGKGFMDHACIEVGEIGTGNAYKLQRYFNTHLHRGGKYSIRLSLAENYQKDSKTLNCSGSIMFRMPEDEFNPYREIKLFAADFKLKRLRNLFKVLPGIVISATALLQGKFYFKINALPKLIVMTEQEPLPESNISLSTEKDEFGVHKAKINWCLSKLTWETVVRSAGSIKDEIERLNFGTVKLYDHVNIEQQNWQDLLFDVNHHMGGCRMSKDSDTGVVNTNLQLWDSSNLYVCSSAVFPTSSHSNPTLTLLALATRLAEFLVQKN